MTKATKIPNKTPSFRHGTIFLKRMLSFGESKFAIFNAFSPSANVKMLIKTEEIKRARNENTFKLTSPPGMYALMMQMKPATAKTTTFNKFTMIV